MSPSLNHVVHYSRVLGTAQYIYLPLAGETDQLDVDFFFSVRCQTSSFIGLYCLPASLYPNSTNLSDEPAMWLQPLVLQFNLVRVPPTH